MAYFTREKDYIIDNGVYTQNNISFIRAKRISKRNATSEKPPAHLYTCYMANEAFVQVGGTATIPVCQSCAEFSSERLVKTSLFGKTQFTPNVAKRFKCKWMLRSTLPNHATRNKDDPEQAQLHKDQTPSSSQVRIREKGNKRAKLTHNEIKQNLSESHEIKMNKMKENMQHTFDIERANLQTIIDAKENTISSILKNLPLKEAMESVIFSRALPKEENKKIATRLCNVVMNKEFLNEMCADIGEKD